MAVIPTVPTLASGSVVTAAQMAELAYAIQFATKPPLAVLEQIAAAPYASGQSIAATTWTPVGWNNTLRDSDGGWSSGQPTEYVIQTPGWWMCTGVWQSTAETSSGYRGAAFQVTTGPNNPGGSGLTTTFGSARVPNVTASGIYSAAGTEMLSPYLYIGDILQFMAYSSHAETTGFTDGGSYMSLQLISL